MKDRNENSYNLSYAKQLLSTLAPRRQKAPTLQPQRKGKPYARLAPKGQTDTSAAALAPTPKRVAEEVGKAPEKTITQPAERFSDWENCIAWCIEVTRAEAAFVVDSQGFIIATRGRIPSHGFECTGAELIYTMDQLERIDPEAGKLLWIDLDFNKRRLVGFVTPAQDNEYYVVGLVAPEASYNDSKNLVSKHIIESLASMN